MKTKYNFKITTLILLLICNLGYAQNLFVNKESNTTKHRIIITADPELDDNNSMIRFLLYSSEFKVEGLIYASSQFHWKGDGKGTKFMVPGREYTKYGLNLCPCESYRWKKEERFIHEAVEAYEKVYSNLKVHNSNYPTPTYLKSKIKYGNIEFEGDFSKNTEGSDLIKKVILDDQPGPVYITAWGGQSTIARALKSIEEEFKQTKEWNLIKEKVSHKVILLPSGDQDNTYASYIKPNWPDIEYRQYKNGPNYGYGAQLVADTENAYFLTPKWTRQHILNNGPLGKIYRVWGDGKQMVQNDPFDYFGLAGFSNDQLKKMGYIVWMPVQEKDSWLGEGDTGTFMNLLSNGLNAYEKESPGGWGGRPFTPNPINYVDPFSNDTSKVKELIISASTLKKLNDIEENTIDFPNFFPAAQNDFATRMNWSVKDKYVKSNHHPIISMTNKQVIETKPGAIISLNAIVRDPDGDKITIKWWQFLKNQNSSKVIIRNEHSLHPTIEVPRNASQNQIIYLLVEVKDEKGKYNKTTDPETPSLTSYKTIKLLIK